MAIDQKTSDWPRVGDTKIVDGAKFICVEVKTDEEYPTRLEESQWRCTVPAEGTAK